MDPAPVIALMHPLVFSIHVFLAGAKVEVELVMDFERQTCDLSGSVNKWW